MDSKILDDALEQYNRRDSIRIYSIPQSDAEITTSRITLNKVLHIGQLVWITHIFFPIKYKHNKFKHINRQYMVLHIW